MHTSSLTRRACLRAAFGLSSAALLSLAGCGFHLRGAYNMAFRSIQLSGFAPNSPVPIELARALDAAGVKVVGSTLEAMQAASSAALPQSHVIFEALADRRDTVVSTPTNYGQVTGMTARIFLRYVVKRADGTVLQPPTEVDMSRDITYSEQYALAKLDETAALQRALQSDVIDQVLRRLAAITPAQMVTPVAPAAQAASSVSANALAADTAASQASAPRNGRVPTPTRPSASSAL